jgi:excisionase family DNA binding protein
VALVDVKTAAKELGVSPRTLYGLTYRREIPFYKIGRKVLFDIDEIKQEKRREPRRKRWGNRYGSG